MLFEPEHQAGVDSAGAGGHGQGPGVKPMVVSRNAVAVDHGGGGARAQVAGDDP